MRETGDKRIYPIGNFLIAGISASAARAAANPYSVVKIIAEVGAPGGKTGFLGGFYWLIRSQGWGALGKGLAPAVVRAFPHVGIQFSVFNVITSNKNFPDLKRRLPVSVSTAFPYVPIYMAGGIAGAVATLVTHPLDVVKVRMVAVPFKSQPYHGIVDGLTKILEQEGVARGLYRGLLPSLIGAFAFSGTMFTLWDIGDRVPTRTAPGAKPFVPYIEWFVVPCAAVIGASVATHPLDVIRRKVMAQSPFLPKNGYVDVRFTNLFECVLNVYKYTGIPGFLFGVFANAAKVIPQLAVFWATSKTLQYALTGGNKEKVKAEQAM